VTVLAMLATLVTASPALAAAAVTVTSPANQAAPSGVAYSKTITALGGTAPYTWSATGLPAGLSINTSTGVISGTPTGTGTSSVTVKATDTASAFGTAAFMITTGVIVSSLSSHGDVTGVPITDLTVRASGGTASYTWSATGLPPGLSINTSSGVITGTPSTDGTYAVRATAIDTAGVSGATSFTWNIGPAPQLSNPGSLAATIGVPVSLMMAATDTNAPFTWSATGLPSGVSINATTGLISGTPSAAWISTVKVTVADSLEIPASVSFPMTVTTPVTITIPGAQKTGNGTPVSLTLAATGGSGTYTWAATNLPAGLAIDSASGAITGSPTTLGTTTVSITATDSDHRTANTSLSWLVGNPVTVTNPGNQSAPGGVAYSRTLTASGGSGPYVWSATGLPAGLSIDPSSGVLSGTPTTSGPANVTVTATDTSGIPGTASFKIFTGVIVASVSSHTDTTGSPITGVTVHASGGTVPYTWTVTGLPPGLSLNTATGTITGTPTNDGAYTVQITATDTTGTTGTASFTWTIQAVLAVADPGTQQATTGSPTNVTLTATGGTSPYTWTALPG
jgi:heme exporter protein D